MEDRSWSQAFSELAATLSQAVVRLWKQDLVQVGLAIGMFLALALPLLIVIVLLWYDDSTGWRPAGGFYKIGSSTLDSIDEASTRTAAIHGSSGLRMGRRAGASRLDHR